MSDKAKGSPFSINLLSWKEAFILLCALAMLCGYHLYSAHTRYKQLPFQSPGEIEALIQAQYIKTKDITTKRATTTQRYYVLKLASDNHTFYTTSREDLKPIIGRKALFYGKVGKDCSFIKYLKSCFFLTFSFSLLPHTEVVKPLKDAIINQHENPLHASLFTTLFFATPLAPAWRDVSNALGLAHIFAISGFHLGIISCVLFALFAPMYRYCQRRWYSYRNEIYDIGAVILLVLFGYLIVLDFAPSFLRAFVMACVGYVLYISGLKILSFSMLGLVGAICVALFPPVLLNRGFLLSMAGVFCIFLFARFAMRWGIIAQLMGLHIAVFLTITPFVHYFFPYFSPYQLISIPISMAFVVLFPLAFVLHVCGLGGVFDMWLDEVLAMHIPRVEVFTPWWFLLVYGVVSAWAMWARAGYYAVLLLASGFYAYLSYVFVAGV